MTTSDGLFARLMAPLRSGSIFVGWAERCFARRACRKLLTIYRQERRAHPQLTGKALYARIAARQWHTDDDAGHTIVRQAEESFADWRFERDVTLRDIAAYLVIGAYLKSKPGIQGTTTEMRNVVTRLIPGDL